MRVAVMKRVWVDMEKAALKRLAKAEAEGLCPACLEVFKEGEARKRGVHVRCYHAMYRAIRAKEASDEDLVAKGFILEASSGGRPRSNPISIAIAKGK